MELVVDETRNLQDLRSYLTSVASKHISTKMSMADVEEYLETLKDKSGKLRFPGLEIKGKLGPLEKQLRESKRLYDDCAKRIQAQPGYQKLKDFLEIRPEPRPQQTGVDGLDDLYRQAADAEKVLCNVVAPTSGEWKVYAVVNHGKTELKKPEAGGLAAFVDDVINPGVLCHARVRVVKCLVIYLDML